jgi:hypothetical protein
MIPEDYELGDRDLLIKISERTLNMWRYMEEIRDHQAEQNGLIKEMCREVDKNTSFRKGATAVLVGLIVVVITKSAGLW